MISRSGGLLHRRAVVAELLRDRGDLLVIAGLGAPNWDVTAAGSAAMIGLGLALAQRKRRVLVITGDGEMLMGLGSLPTIAVQKPDNLTLCVLDNERFGETGMQKTHTAHGIDLAGIAKAAGFPVSLLVRKPNEVTKLRDLAHSGAGPIFAQVKIDPEALPFVLPPAEGGILKNRFRASVLGEEATV
jgi:thiamine pyrophosphate-dependent acetolactate synthase large subunit-like protein